MESGGAERKKERMWETKTAEKQGETKGGGDPEHGRSIGAKWGRLDGRREAGGDVFLKNHTWSDPHARGDEAVTGAAANLHGGAFRQ